MGSRTAGEASWCVGGAAEPFGWIKCPSHLKNEQATKPTQEMSAIGWEAKKKRGKVATDGWASWYQHKS